MRAAPRWKARARALSVCRAVQLRHAPRTRKPPQCTQTTASTTTLASRCFQTPRRQQTRQPASRVPTGVGNRIYSNAVHFVLIFTQIFRNCRKVIYVNNYIYC